jgi:hypothetical protein
MPPNEEQEMTYVQIDYSGHKLDFNTAQRLALSQASVCDIKDPAVISWYQRSTHRFSPSFDGADEASWWAKFGAGNGGLAEVAVGDDFNFIITESGGYERLRGLPLRSMKDASGTEFLCLLPLVAGRDQPSKEACMPLDEWMADQY